MIALSLIIVAVGLVFLVSALLNWDWYKGITDYAAIEALFGEDAARWVCGFAGIVVIGLGIGTFFGMK
ncbi:MAG: immunity 17 family protein [Planctomycetia bacterium]|nr:immunity 17 family protein [Planctomycetia bacterium]